MPKVAKENTNVKSDKAKETPVVEAATEPAKKTKQKPAKQSPAPTPPAPAPTAQQEQPKVTQQKEKRAPKRAAPAEGNEDSEDAKKAKRHFKCIWIDTDGAVVSSGRYSGKKPKQAGNKACTRIFKNYKKKKLASPDHIVFGIHECTRNAKKKKKYFYVGTREKLDEPLNIKIKKVDPTTGESMEIPYNYNNKVKKLTDLECAEYALLSKYDVKDGDGDEDVEVEVKPPKKKHKGSGKESAKKDPVKKEPKQPKTDEKKSEKKVEQKVSKKTEKAKTSETKGPSKKNKKVTN